MFIRNFLPFFLSAYLFRIGHTRPHKISQILNISATHILRWGVSPLWRSVLFLMGHRGKLDMKGLLKYRHERKRAKFETRRMHINRLNKLKDEMLRYYGSCSPDLTRAEILWTRYIKSNTLLEKLTAEVSDV